MLETNALVNTRDDRKGSRLEHRFVGFLREELEEGVLYVSMSYAIAWH
jgi:hypothetical protein